MTRACWVACAGLVLMLRAPWPARGADEAVFEMKRVSPIGLDGGDLRFRHAVGQRAQCKRKPNPRIKAWPTPVSAEPLYSSVTFDQSYNQTKGGMQFGLMLDESRGTGTGYDRLYFDLNRDGNLINDAALKPLADPPKGLYPFGKEKRVTCFEYLTVPFDHGPGLGQRPFRILPRLVEWSGGFAAVFFASTVAWEGKIRIGDRDYNAVLEQEHAITGRFDRPWTALHLDPVHGSELSRPWLERGYLNWMRLEDNTFYRVTATPTGDKLIVRPYEGEFGLFEIGAGGRKISKLGASGRLSASTWTVPIGHTQAGDRGRVRRSRIPVGDYLPGYMRIDFGRLHIFVTNNYHSDGHPRDRQGRPRVYGVKIRKDKPFVLDFSNKPEVLFASPAKDQRFRRGDKVVVNGVLIDPALDIMIRDLTKPAAEVKETRARSTRRNRVSLNPTVTITNSRGERVAEGVMPFG